MTLTAVGTNTIVGERGDNVTSLPITDSTTLTAGDFLELSSGKLIKSVTTLSTTLVGIANTTKEQLVAATSRQEYMGVIAEGLVICKGLVEGSGGTYQTALAVGDKVSFHYDATTGYGQFAVYSESAPIGTVVQGVVASSGDTTDQWDYVLVQLDFESAGGSTVPSQFTKTITSTAAYKHQFRAATQYIYSSAANQLDIVSPSIVISGATALRQIYASLSYTVGKEAIYIINNCTATSGTVTGIRARAEGAAAGTATTTTNGLHAQGIAKDALFAATVNAIYAEAIAKATSTSTTIRGAMIACDSEGTPTDIGVMTGAHIRVKTSVAPATTFIGLIVESEKFGSGVALTSFIDIATATWTGGSTVATDVITTENLVGTVTNVFNYSTVTATSAFYSDATITNFLEVSADSKGGAGATRSSPNQTATCDGSIVVKIGAKTLLIPVYNAVTIA